MANQARQIKISQQSSWASTFSLIMEANVTFSRFTWFINCGIDNSDFTNRLSYHENTN